MQLSEAEAEEELGCLQIRASPLYHIKECVYCPLEDAFWEAFPASEGVEDTLGMAEGELSGVVELAGTLPRGVEVACCGVEVGCGGVVVSFEGATAGVDEAFCGGVDDEAGVEDALSTVVVSTVGTMLGDEEVFAGWIG